MNCFECVRLDGLDRPAVAVCTHCGAAVCLDHSRSLAAAVPTHAGLGAHGSDHTRDLACPTCEAALAASRT